MSRRPQQRAGTGRGMKPVLAMAVAGLAFLTQSTNAPAGAFIFAGESNGLDLISHPQTYTGAGGTIYVQVCILAGTPNSALVVRPLQNAMKEVNFFNASSPNLFFGGNNDIPSGAVDFESLALHEIGHCQGLAHPNLATESNLPAEFRDYTKTTNGADDSYGLDAGTDTIIGSSDDLRGDDENLHWFEIGVNNPLQLLPDTDTSNFTRDVAQLPMADDFVANADRDVAADLGYPNTEAVMQQGQFTDEDQRRLTADDINQLSLARSGLDETHGTADDYVARLVYGGIRANTSGCDVVVRESNVGLAQCSTSGLFFNTPGSDNTHIKLFGSEFIFDNDVNFHFNQTPRGGCSTGDDTLAFSAQAVGDRQFHEACSNISYGPSFSVTSSGKVTAIAPSVSLLPGVSIDGEFRVVNIVP